MACPACGGVVAVTDQFCSNCFARLERPTFWRRLASWFQSAFKPGTHTLVVRRNVSIRTASKQGERHAYCSLDEVPPEFRAQFEQLQSEATKELDAGLPAAIVSEDAPKPGIIVHKEIQVFKFKDASGKEQVYHSLEQMPPEQRAIFEKAQVFVREESREYRFKDVSGKEQVYHSLDEMPPETRVIFEKAQDRLDLPDQTNKG